MWAGIENVVVPPSDVQQIAVGTNETRAWRRLR